jgi:hypothetical protein
MRTPPLLVQLLFACAAVLFVYSMSSTVAPAPSRAPRRLSTAAFEPPAASRTSSGAEDGLQPLTAAAGADASFWLPAPLAGGARTAAQQISACKSRRGPAQQRKLSIISPCQSDDTACKIVSRATARSVLVIGVAATPDGEKRKELLSAARDVVGTGELLAVVSDTAAIDLPWLHASAHHGALSSPQVNCLPSYPIHRPPSWRSRWGWRGGDWARSVAPSWARQGAPSWARAPH